MVGNEKYHWALQAGYQTPQIGANVHWEIINHQKQICGIWFYMVLTLTKLDALSFCIKLPLHGLVKNIIFLPLTIAFNCTCPVMMGTMRMIWTTLMTFDSVGNSFELFRNGVNSDGFSEPEGKRPMMMAAVMNMKMWYRECCIPTPRYKCIGWLDGCMIGWMHDWMMHGWIHNYTLI